MMLLPITKSEELSKNQQPDRYCQIMVTLVGTDARFMMNEHRQLRREATIDGSIHVIVPEVFDLAVLYKGHYPILAGHPGTRRI